MNLTCVCMYDILLCIHTSGKVDYLEPCEGSRPRRVSKFFPINTKDPVTNRRTELNDMSVSQVMEGIMMARSAAVSFALAVSNCSGPLAA